VEDIPTVIEAEVGLIIEVTEEDMRTTGVKEDLMILVVIEEKSGMIRGITIIYILIAVEVVIVMTTTSMMPDVKNEN
jgi:hypothetical protein